MNQFFDVQLDVGSVFDDSSGSFWLFSRPNVTMLISPEIPCNKKHVVIVLSAPKNQNLRNRQRRQLGKKASVFFLIGKSESYDELVLKESEREKDIIKADLIDSYRILPYKVILGYIWANR